MLRNALTAVVAAVAIAATPALAKPGGGQGAGAAAKANVNAGGAVQVNANPGSPAGAALDSRMNSMGPANASPTGVLNANPNSVLRTNTLPTPDVDARVNSRGQMNANTRAISRANPNSALARGAVPSTALPGLDTGLTVQTSTGATIGTVSQVVTGTDGSIRLVVVTSPTGETLRLVPSTLSISGDVVTATEVDIGG